ncbi:MAG TPA: shikimate dehydrogenase [Caulobacteraceae bacterium]|nr:shikimate dehydrogenase [Caulobacteraceae bacterium]
MGRILTGLIGAGIQQSRSPFMHEAEASALGLDLRYSLFDLKAMGLGAEALPQVLDEAQRQGLAGVNVTHPCKQAVIPLLDAVTLEAAAIGAVNTVVFSDGRRTGHNTDAWGFGEAFRRRMPGAPLGRVLQLGAGGAGAATAHALLALGVERLAILDADVARARALAAKMAATFGAGRVDAVTDLAGALADSQGLVHATPTGMADHPGLPLPATLLRPDLWVAEVVYFPLETELLAQARARGCRAIDGGGMAVFQAAKAFELFTGIAPDTERMLARFGDHPPAKAG